MTEVRPHIRVFSYLPNPRVWKSLIAAEFCGVDVEVRGDKPAALANWLWDFDSRELTDADKAEQTNARASRRGFQGTLYKTDAFLNAHPFGTVPAAFSDDGSVGVFESNSILRTVARISNLPHGLYGNDAWQSSRIDSFLDAGTVFAREVQYYLLAINEMTEAIHDRTTAAYDFYMTGIDQALSTSTFIANNHMSLADIAFACDLVQFHRERRFASALHDAGLSPISQDAEQLYPRAYAHLKSLCGVTEFERHLAPFLDTV